MKKRYHRCSFCFIFRVSFNCTLPCSKHGHIFAHHPNIPWVQECLGSISAGSLAFILWILRSTLTKWRFLWRSSVKISNVCSHNLWLDAKCQSNMAYTRLPAAHTHPCVCATALREVFDDVRYRNVTVIMFWLAHYIRQTTLPSHSNFGSRQVKGLITRVPKLRWLDR